MQHGFLRAAFTLIEGLVVIVIVAIATGLTLSAVQRVRAAALRTECLNHLKQIGLAAHAYHDANKALPPGVRDEESGDPYPFLSWQARLLPFIEQDALWVQTQQAFAKDPFFRDNPPHVGFSTVVRSYTCPADVRAFAPAQIQELRIAYTSYVGVEGTNLFRKDGVLFLNSQVRFTDITDGTSNTLLAGERPACGQGNFGWWYGGWGQDKDGSGDVVLGVRERNVGSIWARSCPPGPFNFGLGQINNQCDVFHFWSLHSGGAHFALCDGSARFFSYTSDPIMPALSTRAGGESISW